MDSITSICRVTEDRVVVTAPIFGGKGYVFDGPRKILTIATRLFGITLSKTEVPFTNIASLELEKTFNPGAQTVVPGDYFKLTMRLDKIGAELAGKEAFEIENPDIFAMWKHRLRAERTESAIREIIGPLPPPTPTPTTVPSQGSSHLSQYFEYFLIPLGIESPSQEAPPESASQSKEQLRRVQWPSLKGELIRLAVPVLVGLALLALVVFIGSWLIIPV